MIFIQNLMEKWILSFVGNWVVNLKILHKGYIVTNNETFVCKK